MNVQASELVTGHSIYDYVTDGERKTRASASVITHTWRHGPLVTVLTARGYVEYAADELVSVTDSGTEADYVEPYRSEYRNGGQW